MSRKEYVHAFRLTKKDEDKLSAIHSYLKEDQEKNWRIGDTMEVLIRDLYKNLLYEGKIIEKEKSINENY